MGMVSRFFSVLFMGLLLSGCGEKDGGTPPLPTTGNLVACGGLAGVACGEGQYCDMGAVQCGAADGQGVCSDIPEACTRELRPVCGCDDKTYNNACLAASAGVSVSSEGACASQAQTCGGIQGEVCSDTAQYCDYGVGNCQKPDFQGMCKVKPEACTREFRPVCGCDGKTHSNACVAASMGTSVLHEGECQ